MSAPPRQPKSLAARQHARVLDTWTAQKDAVPLEIVSGQGAFFTTADGAQWWDFGSVTWNANLGHGHPAMRHALSVAAERGLLTYPTAVFPDKLAAAELLLQVAPPGLRSGKVFLCLSGAEANENAVKMARLATGRRKIVYRSRSYHGATLGMLSLSGDPRRKAFDPGLQGGVCWDDTYEATPGPNDLEHLLKAEDPETVAAVMLEGVVGANGVFVPPRGYYRRIREICDRHGVLFIADEVLSGFGRTGKWFAVDHDGVSPDLLTCAKGLTGGYAPGGAVVVSESIARHFDDNYLPCGLTAYAHPLTCAAIVAAITAYRDEDLIARAATTGEALAAMLPAFTQQRRYIAEARGVGLLWAFDLREDPEGAQPASAVRMKALAMNLRSRHLHMHKRDNLLFLAPPLMITEADLATGLVALGAALDATWGVA